MSRTAPILAALAASALLVQGAAANAAPPRQGALQDQKFHTVALKMPRLPRPLPYTIDVPESWAMQPWLNNSWLLIGPPSAQPAEKGKAPNPEVIVVRQSTVSLADPQTVLKNVRANAALDQDAKWNLIELRDVAGTKALATVIEAGSGEAHRITYILKLPLGAESVDFMVSCPAGSFSEYRPLYEKIFASVKKAG